ncbi:FG-GAP-like repeat-containing protein, partial [Fulvivirga kasyanovii]
DLNNDGLNDFIANGDEIYWGINNGDSTFTTRALPLSKIFVQDVIILDYNNDNFLDIAVIKTSSRWSNEHSSVLLWKNNGGQYFSGPYTIVSSIDYANSLVTLDYNDDNYDDLAIGRDYNSPKITYSNGTVSGWSLEALVESDGFSSFISLDDMNNDGNIDVISNGGGWLHLNDQELKASTGHSSFVETSDVDRDGMIDIIVEDSYDRGLVVLKNTGTGFEKQKILGTGGQSFVSIEMYDFDSDGDDDLVTAGRSYPHGIGYFENIGNGNFKAYEAAFLRVPNDNAFAVGDLNGDGVADVIYSDLGDHTVKVMYGGIEEFEGILADFSLPEITCLSEEIKFNQTSRGLDIVEWYWTFGDGSYSTERNPSHKFTTSGLYNVKLKVTNTRGQSDVVEKLIEVFDNPVFDDINVSYCGNGSYGAVSIQLDSMYQYKWYYNNNSDTQPFHEGSQYTGNMWANSIYYVEAIDTLGCKTINRFEVLATKRGIPAIPNIISEASSTHGPTELHIQTDYDSNTGNVYWYNSIDDEQPFKVGVEIFEYVENTRRVYYKAVSNYGCESQMGFVDLIVINQPSPNPYFIWGDPTEASNWSEGLDITKTQNNEYLVLGKTRGNLSVGNLTIETDESYRFIITYNSDNEPVGLSKIVSYDKASMISYSDNIFVDSEDNLYYINSFTTGNVTIGDSTITISTSGYNSQRIIAKLDKKGDLLWYRAINGYAKYKNDKIYILEGTFLTTLNKDGSVESSTNLPISSDNFSVNSSGDIIMANTYYSSEVIIGDSVFIKPPDEWYQSLIFGYNQEGSLLFAKRMPFEKSAKISSIERIQ